MATGIIARAPTRQPSKGAQKVKAGAGEGIPPLWPVQQTCAAELGLFRVSGEVIWLDLEV